MVAGPGGRRRNQLSLPLRAAVSAHAGGRRPAGVRSHHRADQRPVLDRVSGTLWFSPGAFGCGARRSEDPVSHARGAVRGTRGSRSCPHHRDAGGDCPRRADDGRSRRVYRALRREHRRLHARPSPVGNSPHLPAPPVDRARRPRRARGRPARRRGSRGRHGRHPSRRTDPGRRRCLRRGLVGRPERAHRRESADRESNWRRSLHGNAESIRLDRRPSDQGRHRDHAGQSGSARGRSDAPKDAAGADGRPAGALVLALRAGRGDDNAPRVAVLDRFVERRIQTGARRAGRRLSVPTHSGDAHGRHCRHGLAGPRRRRRQRLGRSRAIGRRRHDGVRQDGNFDARPVAAWRDRRGTPVG